MKMFCRGPGYFTGTSSSIGKVEAARRDGYIVGPFHEDSLENVGRKVGFSKPSVKNKKCSKCKILKPVEEFYKKSESKTGLDGWCKSCCKQSQNKYQKTEKGKSAGSRANRKYYSTDKRKKDVRNNHLKRCFGLTTDDYNKMAENQNNLCAICGLPSVQKSLHLDHNHNTKKVRGLLCQKCNHALGLLKVDNFGILNLQKAIKYLEIEND